MRARATAALCLIATATLIAAPAADALESGVHVNPRSPSGTEYSFPLGSTRQQLGGHSAAGASAGSGPLFGAGLGHRAAGGHGGGRDRGHGGGRAGGHGGGHPRTGTAASRPGRRGGGTLARQQGEAIAELGQDGSDPGAIALVVGVIAVGGAGGLALWWFARRRRSDRR